jgi:membrane protein YqaA with SNARE-associated domain
MTTLLTLFVAVFALNVMPAFAPPTWAVMSFLGLGFPDSSPWAIAFVAAAGATSGRSALALLVKHSSLHRRMSPAMRDNLADVARFIEERRRTSIAAFLLFAFSPLPSSALFLAYGLTRAPLRLLAVPFFCGRLVSYLAAFAGGAYLARKFDFEFSGASSLLYFGLSQISIVAIVYVFTKIHWRRSLSERRLHWLS